MGAKRPICLSEASYGPSPIGARSAGHRPASSAGSRPGACFLFGYFFFAGAKKKRLAVAAKRRAKALLCVVSLAVHRQEQDMFRLLLRSSGEARFLYLC